MKNLKKIKKRNIVFRRDKKVERDTDRQIN